jgi:hypothetical protein
MLNLPTIVVLWSGARLRAVGSSEVIREVSYML